MHSYQYNIPVDFSFIASPCSNYCTENDTEFQKPVNGPNLRLLVTTHLVDPSGDSKVQVFAYNRQHTMRSLYYAISESSTHVGCIVCYTFLRKKESCFSAFVERVLLPGDSIPEVVFYQYISPFPPKSVQRNWVFLNFLVFSQNMKLQPGCPPLIAGFTTLPTKKELLDYVVSRLTTTLFEITFLKSCPMTSATVTQEGVRIEDGYGVSSDEAQAAILMPWIEPGDVVRASIPGRGGKAHRTLQGVIQNSRIDNGMVSYDVQNTDTYEIFYGLNCLQVIPL